MRHFGKGWLFTSANGDGGRIVCLGQVRISTRFQRCHAYSAEGYYRGNDALVTPLDEEVAGELSGADRGSPARVFSSRRRGAGIAASCIKAWSTASKKSFINIGTPSGASLD